MKFGIEICQGAPKVRVEDDAQVSECLVGKLYEAFGAAEGNRKGIVFSHKFRSVLGTAHDTNSVLLSALLTLVFGLEGCPSVRKKDHLSLIHRAVGTLSSSGY